MYEVFKELLKMADDMVDVTECHFQENGDIRIIGTDTFGETMFISISKKVEEDADS